MFQLTLEEVTLVKSQFATSPSSTLFQGQGGGRRKLPYVFTEQGIYMLATVLRGELAEKQSIYIMRAFREMRHFLANNKLMFSCHHSIRLFHRHRFLPERQGHSDGSFRSHLTLVFFEYKKYNNSN